MLSTTAVVFIRSEGKLKTKHLYWIWKPKQVLKQLKLKVIGSLRGVKSVKPNGNWKPKKLEVLNLIDTGTVEGVKLLA